MLADSSETSEKPQPITIALVLLSEDKDQNEEDDEIPKMLDTYIRAAQANNKTY
jgi:hypothetical protein